MKTNEGIWDRAARVALGAALIALTVVGPKSAWGLIGIIPLATGLAGYCPLYQLFGLSTCPVDRKNAG